jgi:hypothetical protein
VKAEKAKGSGKTRAKKEEPKTASKSKKGSIKQVMESAGDSKIMQKSKAPRKNQEPGTRLSPKGAQPPDTKSSAAENEVQEQMTKEHITRFTDFDMTDFRISILGFTRQQSYITQLTKQSTDMAAFYI